MNTAQNLPVTYDEAMLEKLAAMANPEDIPITNMVDQLKINYDEESIHPRGIWVLGQRKNKENVITEQGEVVDNVIFLTVRCRYTYYHEKTKETVSTQIFKSGDQPNDKAECAAKVAALGGQLKFQYVIFGMACCEGGKLKEFVSYLGGSSFMPVKEYLLVLTTIITATKKITAPLYAHMTLLGPTEKKKNGTITYYIPSFQRGAGFTLEQIEFFAKKRDEASDYCEHMNEMAASYAAKKEEAPPVAPPITQPSMAEYIPPANNFDVGAMKSANPTKMEDDVPFDLPGTVPSASTGSDSGVFDIEAAMAAVINGTN